MKSQDIYGIIIIFEFPNNNLFLETSKMSASKKVAISGLLQKWPKKNCYVGTFHCINENKILSSTT